MERVSAEPVEVMVPASDAMDTEPAITEGMVKGAILAVIGLLVAVGVPVSEELKLAILGLVGPLWVFYTAWAIRKRVYAPRTVRKIAGEVQDGAPLEFRQT